MFLFFLLHAANGMTKIAEFSGFGYFLISYTKKEHTGRLRMIILPREGSVKTSEEYLVQDLRLGKVAK